MTIAASFAGLRERWIPENFSDRLPSMPGLFCDAYRDVRLGRIDDSCRVVLMDYLLLWGRHSLSRHLFYNVCNQVYMTGSHSVALQCAVDFCCYSCVIYVNISVGWRNRRLRWWSL